MHQRSTLGHFVKQLMGDNNWNREFGLCLHHFYLAVVTTTHLFRSLPYVHHQWISFSAGQTVLCFDSQFFFVVSAFRILKQGLRGKTRIKHR